MKDQQLIEKTKLCAEKTQLYTLKLMKYLNEIEERRLYSDLGFSTLFKFVVQELGFSESEASAARAIKVVPKAIEKLEKNEMTLTNLSMISGVLTGLGNEATQMAHQKFLENPDELVELVCGKTQGETQTLVDEIKGESPKEKTKKKKQANGTLRISATLSKEAASHIELLRQKQNLNSELDIIEYALKETVKAWQKKQQNLGTRSESAKSEGRRLSAKLKRQIREKSGHQCEKCGTQRNLQYDHIKPLSVGGKSTIENLRLLCQSCNLREGIRILGPEVMKKRRR